MFFLLDLISLTGISEESLSPIATQSFFVNFGSCYLRSSKSSFSLPQLIIPKRIDPVKRQIRQLKLRSHFLQTSLIIPNFDPRSCPVSRLSSTIPLVLQPEKPQIRQSMASFRAVSWTFWLFYQFWTPQLLALMLQKLYLLSHLTKK